MTPPEWLQGVDSAPLPMERPALPATADVASKFAQAIEERTDWQVFGIAQTDRLEIANGRMREAVGVIQRCEKRDAAAIARIEAPWWRRPFLPAPDT